MDIELVQMQEKLSSLRERYISDWWSPIFLAPGTGFMGDNFSMDRPGWVAAGGAQAVMPAKLGSLTHHLPPAMQPGF